LVGSGQDLDPTRHNQDFVGFYRAHFESVWRTLLRLGVDRLECDDAAQEVFVTAHRRWSTLQDAGLRRAWLFGIVRRIAFRYRRTRDRYDRRIEAYARLDSTDVDLDRELHRRQAWANFLAFLDTLDDQKRAAFVLGEFEDLSRPELGVALGINANTAYSRLQAARRRFIAHFSDDDERCVQALTAAVDHGRPPARSQDGNLAGVLPLLGRSTAMTGPSTGAMTWAWLAMGSLVTVVAGALASVATKPDEHEARIDPAPPIQVVALSANAANAAISVALRSGLSSDETRSIIHEPRPTPSPRAVPTRTDAARTDSRPTTNLDAELAPLLAARRAMVEGDIARARAHLDEHRHRFGARAALARVRTAIENELSAESGGR